MSYSLKMLLRDRIRYLSAVLAVTFSALGIAIQCGLLFGFVQYSSLPIDHSSAEIWVTTTDAKSMTLAHAIPESWLLRVAAQPEVERTEVFLQGESSWHKPRQGSSEMCIVVGMRLHEGALGMAGVIPPATRARLAEPDTVVVDESDLKKLGLRGPEGDFAEVGGHRVRVVGTVAGFAGVTAPYVFCSIETARRLLPFFGQRRDLTLFVLAKCHNAAEVPAVVARLQKQYGNQGMAVYTREDFSQMTRSYWLLRTQAGMMMAVTVILAVLVGTVVTSHTLRAAALASLRQYAMLDALGIPRWRLMALVMTKSFWIGVIGLALSLPVIYGGRWLAAQVRVTVELKPWMMIATILLTMGIALISGALSLRELRKVEPANLLR
jgi:putative ABC transport system permease protein